jgi:hypothetical protein
MADNQGVVVEAHEIETFRKNAFRSLYCDILELRLTLRATEPPQKMFASTLPPLVAPSKSPIESQLLLAAFE